MAKSRMFDLNIVDTDLFLEMPASSQNLYFHLGMRADDDGFIGNPKKIIRTVGANEDDLKILISKNFIIPFNNGIIVIRHWRINNHIRKDRYTETIYKSEKAQLVVTENGSYNLMSRNDIPVDNQMTTNLATNWQPSIGKESIGKVSKVECSRVEERGDSCGDGSFQSTQENDSCGDGFLQHTHTQNNLIDGFDRIVDFYNNNIGLLTSYGKELLEDFAKEIEIDAIIYALKKATEANKRSLTYIKAILNNWLKKGIKTLIDAQNESESYQSKKNFNQPIDPIETQEERNARRLKEIEEAMKNATK